MHGPIYIRLMNSAEWHRIRAKQLHAQPYCEICLSHKVVRPAEVVHHITEVETGRTEQEQRSLAYAESNLQSLCKRCHNKLHAEKKSHSKAAHKERQKSRMEAWIAQQKGNVQNGGFEG